MKSNKKTEVLKYFVPPLITITVILIVYAVKGQYPFGTGTMMDNDWGVADFPGFVRFWDVAHGKESLLFDWSTGLGLPKSAIGYFFYPVNYMLLFFKRDFLYEAMNFFYIAQMATISVTSFAFFRNAFKKLPLYFTYLFSLAFTFCGFNLQYYSNINWLSAIAVFPLVALATYKLLNGKGFVFYSLILAYSLVVSTYFSFFFLEGIVLIGTLYVFCFLEKQDRKGAAFRLGMGTVSAFLISFWAVFGFAFSTLGSTRVEADVGSGFLSHIINILKTESDVNSYKILMLLGTEIGIVSLALILIKYRKEKKKGLFFLTGFVLFALPIVFENIDLILNGGSYNFYVMRNGFLVSFFLFLTAAYYFSHFDSTDEKEKKKFFAYLKPILCVLALYIYIPYHLVMLRPLALRDALNDNGKMTALSILSNIGSSFLIAIIALVLFLLITNKRPRHLFISVLVCFTVVASSFMMIGAAKDSAEFSNNAEEYILDCREISKDVEYNDVFRRISVPDDEMAYNYAMLINRTSISDWTHIVGADFRGTFYRLGYGMAFTDVSDVGGTAFSNALLGVYDCVSKSEPNFALTNKKAQLKNGYSLFENRYVIPFGICIDKKMSDIRFDGNLFEYQNDIFSLLTKDGSRLFERAGLVASSVEKYKGHVDSYYDENFELEKDMYKGTFTYHTDEKSVLYFYLDDGSDITTNDIIVDSYELTLLKDGNKITEKRIERSGHFNNILELGTFENEDVTIELNSQHSEIDKPVVYAMSLEKLGELCENCESCVTEYSTGKRSMHIKATGEEGKYLFIPVYNNGSWVCTVNGEKTEVTNILGSFMAIPMKDAENEINIKYVPKTLYLTLVISAFSLAVFGLIMLFIRKKQIRAPEKLQSMFLWALTGLFSAFIAVAYIAPLIAQVYYAFVGRE